MSKLLSAVALQAQLEPYKKLLGILVRQDCISLAISNPYLNLAEPLGGLMLRDGRLSTRSLQRMLAAEQEQLAGYIVGCEVKGRDGETGGAQTQEEQQQQQQQAHSAHQQQAVQQIQGVLASLSPGLPGGWYGSWSAEGGASCRILPPGGPAAAASDTDLQQQGAAPSSLRAAAGSSSGSDAAASSSAANDPLSQQQQQQEQPRCSLGQQFLQDYLDSLGSLNTFG